RVLGGAVERNRIKRRVREAVRLERAKLTAIVDVVINPKKSAMTVEFEVLREEVARAFGVIAGKMAAKGSRQVAAGRRSGSRPNAGKMLARAALQSTAFIFWRSFLALIRHL